MTAIAMVFLNIEMANCLLDIDDKNITYYLDGNNAQFLRENHSNPFQDNGEYFR